MSHKPKDQGAHAFPCPDTQYNYHQEGMMMRQWYAGQALAGLLACNDGAGAHWGAFAADAFAIADAMIGHENAERSLTQTATVTP
ncbi:MAG: hypothetical protein HOO99_04020 [Hyphomicrobiaceae bacterium]|nr:hypothetical protein [Hyphomicrobiaceae bacterium]